MESPPWTFHWLRASGSESCVTDGELAQLLRQATEADGVARVPLTIDGTLTRDAASGAFQARLHVSDGRGETLGVRELTSSGPSCSALTPSIVLVLSILVELAAQSAAAPQAQTTPPAPRDTASPQQGVPWETTAKSAAVKRWWFEPSAALAVALNLAFGTRAGPALGLRVRTPWWIAFVARTAYFSQPEDSYATSDASEISVKHRFFQSDLSLCAPFFRHPAWWLAGCGGVAFVVHRVDTTVPAELGASFDAASHSSRLSVGFDASLQLAYAISPRWVASFDVSLLTYQVPSNSLATSEPGDFGRVSHAYHSEPAGVFSLGIGVRL
jgi:hypothetical protein